MAKKKLNILVIVFAALIVVGLVLAIVGMCTGVITANGESTTLFDEGWAKMAEYKDQAAKANITLPSRTFPIIAFVVLLVGAVVALVSAVLDLLGKGNKLIGLCGGAVAVVGGVLVLVAGLVLAGQYNDYLEFLNKATGGIGGLLAGAAGVDLSASAGVGVWLGFIGGLVAGVSAVLYALKIGQK